MTRLVSETWEFIETPGCWAVLHKRDTPLETKMAAKELSNSESRTFHTNTWENTENVSDWWLQTTLVIIGHYTMRIIIPR